MTRVAIDITIECAADEIFAYISNFENNPLWQGGMKEAHFTSDGPLAVGSTYKQMASFLGRRIETNFEVLEYEPGKRVKAKSTSGTFPIQFTRWVETLDEGASPKTRVQALIEGEAGGIFKLFGPLLDRMVRKSIESDYANLKRIMEEV